MTFINNDWKKDIEKAYQKGRQEREKEILEMIENKIEKYKKALKYDLDNLNFDIISGSKIALEELKQKIAGEK